MEMSTIDLNRAEKAVSTLITNDTHQREYQPRTLQTLNLSRQLYLPMYPNISFGSKGPWLLANVPGLL